MEGRKGKTNKRKRMRAEERKARTGLREGKWRRRTVCGLKEENTGRGLGKRKGKIAKEPKAGSRKRITGRRQRTKKKIYKLGGEGRTRDKIHG